MMVPCRHRNGTTGKFATNCADPLTVLLGRFSLQENLVTEDQLNFRDHTAIVRHFADWCNERNICIRNIYSGFFTAIPTMFLEKQVLFAAEFQTADDAMLFRLSWIN